MSRRRTWESHGKTTFADEHYRLDDAIAEPKPLQRPYPPIWIGGSGRKRTLRIVARYADVWNMPGGTPTELAELSQVLDQHCSDVGRNLAEIRRSVQVRLPEQPSDVLPLVEEYAGVGTSDIILIVMGGTAETQAKEAATVLPQLRDIG